MPNPYILVCKAEVTRFYVVTAMSEVCVLFMQCMHGDLTTRNILLNKTHTVAKIGDLGLSKTLQASITEANHGGTLAFAAPEVLLNMRCNEKVPPMLQQRCC